MKTVLIAAAASLLLSLAAHAAELRPAEMTAAGATAAGACKPTVTHMAFVPGMGTACCADQLRCTQLLATTMIELPHRSPRT